jgi:histone acetyltransferase SAS3
VVVSAEPESGRRRNSKIATTDTNGIDSDIDAEGEDDIDGEYEMDGDVVMET